MNKLLEKLGLRTPEGQRRSHRRSYIRGSGQLLYGASFATFVSAVFAGFGAMLLLLYVAPELVMCRGQSAADCQPMALGWGDMGPELLILLLLALISVLTGFIVGILISHRTFGPVVRLKSFIQELIDGKYGNQVKLRKKDHFKDVAELLNQLSNGLAKKHGKKDV